MSPSFRFAAFFLLSLGLSASLMAQQPSDPLASIRTKDVLADEDRAALKTFLTDRINALKGDNVAASAQAFAELRTAFDGSAKGFRDAFTSTVIPMVAQNYAAAKDAGAAQMIALLGVLNTVETVNIVTEAMKDERTAVRGAAAAVLRQLREKLAQAGGDNVTRAVAALREAGKKETGRESLRLIYRAVNYAELPSPDARTTISATLDILDARAKAYAEADVRAFAAEDIAFRNLTPLVGQLGEDDKKRAIEAVGAVLKSCMQHYVLGERLISAKPNTSAMAERDRVAGVLEEGEKLLVAILAPQTPPNMQQHLRKADESKLRGAWKAWADLIKTKSSNDYSISE